MEKQIGEQAPALDAKSIDEMKKTGALKPVALDAKDAVTFRATVDKLTNSQRGVLMPGRRVRPGRQGARRLSEGQRRP